MGRKNRGPNKAALRVRAERTDCRNIEENLATRGFRTSGTRKIKDDLN